MISETHAIRPCVLHLGSSSAGGGRVFGSRDRQDQGRRARLVARGAQGPSRRTGGCTESGQAGGAGSGETTNRSKPRSKMPSGLDPGDGKPVRGRRRQASPPPSRRGRQGLRPRTRRSTICWENWGRARTSRRPKIDRETAAPAQSQPPSPGELARRRTKLGGKDKEIDDRLEELRAGRGTLRMPTMKSGAARSAR